MPGHSANDQRHTMRLHIGGCFTMYRASVRGMCRRWQQPLNAFNRVSRSHGVLS